MRKISRRIATVVLLCAVVFLGGEWPEETPRRKVVTLDGAALATALVCGLYLKKEEEGEA